MKRSLFRIIKKLMTVYVFIYPGFTVFSRLKSDKIILFCKFSYTFAVNVSIL